CGGSATTTTDLNTIDLVRAMQSRHFARFGTYPHIIINHLARRKLDANRTAEEAACGSGVDIQRNGVVVATTPNDGTHTDILGKVSGTFTYRVCNAGTTTCSTAANVSF